MHELSPPILEKIKYFYMIQLHTNALFLFLFAHLYQQRYSKKIFEGVNFTLATNFYKSGFHLTQSIDFHVFAHF